jgi:hypothetical protein
MFKVRENYKLNELHKYSQKNHNMFSTTSLPNKNLNLKNDSSLWQKEISYIKSTSCPGLFDESLSLFIFTFQK